MGALHAALREIGTEAECKVKSELCGPIGSLKTLFYNLITPLILNFETEDESYHFLFQKGGSVSLRTGSHTTPDVTVKGEHAELLYLLQNRDKERFRMAERTRKLTITARTFTGRQAVAKLRDLFL